MKDMQKDKMFVTSWINERAEKFYPYADAIWSFAELGCEEVLSSQLLSKLLEHQGFKVMSGVANMPTAFVAHWGEGKPVIGFSCEYDALPGLSQYPIAEKRPVVEGAPGHGCGHNLLGVGGIMAAVATKEWLKEKGLEGKLVVLGTPAEEICIGKPYMARAGFFQGFDAILDWHPWEYNAANYDTCNAYFSVKYHFLGRTAHGNAPWEGRSALDSALLMGHSIELLREHISPGQSETPNTINYTFPDVGPEYPNVVPDRSTIWIIGRIAISAEMDKIIKRIHKCAEAASLATETSLEIEFVTASHEKIPNKTLSSVLYRNLLEIGPPKFDLDEKAFGKKMQGYYGVEQIGFREEIMEFQNGASGVTDNSEYSWFAPFAMVYITSAPAGIGLHNWNVAACARNTIGKKAMKVGSKVLAASAVELIAKPEVIKEARAELAERLNRKTYLPLIPEDAHPTIDINSKTMEKYRSLMEKYYEKIV